MALLEAKVDQEYKLQCHFLDLFSFDLQDLRIGRLEIYITNNVQFEIQYSLATQYRSKHAGHDSDLTCTAVIQE